MHRNIKALRIKLKAVAADNSGLCVQNRKLRADIAAATTTAEDFRSKNKNICAQLDVANANATILMKKLNKEDLESQRKIDLYYKQRSISYAHATMVENKCRRPEAKLRSIQAKVAAANDIANTLCKQLEDACADFGDICWYQRPRRISRATKVNKDLEDELADFSSKISGILAKYNERDRSSTAIAASPKRALPKVNQQLHNNDLYKRRLINHNIITQRSDEQTQVLVDWSIHELEYRGTMHRNEHIGAECMTQTEASNGHLAESMEHFDDAYESWANSSTQSFVRRPPGLVMGNTPVI
ncbi:hypothetical protein GGF37_004940 [Kickxella alabastrina]|nr:hypothetical protein GGF37_004940 [Kickxella alabastrina]